MKTITGLSGTLTEGNFQEPPTHHHHVGDNHEIPVKGKTAKSIYARAFRVGTAGIILTNGKISIAIPKEEIWKLAEKCEPGLAIPTQSEPPALEIAIAAAKENPAK